MTKPLCIFHAPCIDGFGAAWVVNEFFKGEVDFHPGVYGAEPPDVTGRDVLIVDFSYSYDTLVNMASDASTIMVLDHHKTAEEALTKIPNLNTLADWQEVVERNMLNEHKDAAEVRALFDMSRSGAGIAWDFFNPGKPRPKMIDYIEDRDLWNFNLIFSKAIHQTLSSYSYDFEIWSDLILQCDTPKGALAMANEGAAMKRKSDKDLAEFLMHHVGTMTILGVRVPVANVPYFWASEAGHILCKDEPFAATYFDRPGERVFSLRSDENGNDVSEIAKKLGGGGHKHAAGFTCGLNVNDVSTAEEPP